MKLVIMFVALYLLLWFLQNVLEIFLDWLHHVADYHAANMSLKVAEREEKLKKTYSDYDKDEQPSTSCVGFQYTAPEEEYPDED